MTNIKALYSYIEENFRNILNVEDILYANRSVMSNLQISIDEYNNYSTDNLYLELRNCRKKAQILLNLYHCPKEYEKCKLLEIGSHLNNTNNKPFGIENVQEINSDIIVEAIGEFVKYHHVIYERELQVELDKNKEITDLLIGSICCFCEMRLDRGQSYCNVCEALKDDMTKYATNHYETLMLVKTQQPKKTSFIYQNVDKVPNFDPITHLNGANYDYKITYKPEKNSYENINEIQNAANRKEKSTENLKINEENIVKSSKDFSEWKCSKCGLLNYDEFCMACLNEKVITNQKYGQEINLEKSGAKNSVEKRNTTSTYRYENVSSMESEKCVICRNETNCNCKSNTKNSAITNENHKETLVENWENNKNNDASATNINSDQWKCDKCGMLNYDDFCSACLNERRTIKLWKCERCKKLNDFFIEKCFSCGKTNENIQLCKKCKSIKIAADRRFCDTCYNNAPHWSCWNEKCSYLNDPFNNYCAICKFQRHKKDIFSIKDISGMFWLCKKCSAINDYEKKVCTSFSCKQKFDFTTHKCEICRKKFRGNSCKYCETKCPTCFYNRCEKCSILPKFKTN